MPAIHCSDDSNGNNIAEATEIITGYRAISGFKDTLLKVKFTGIGSTTAQFSYAYIKSPASPTVLHLPIISTGPEVRCL
jgi:hypothetical protein